MRLNPEEFTATPDDPYVHDLLGRASQINALCDIMQNAAGHAVVSIDGPWGSGKTAFVAMCSAELRRRGTRVVDFNAWQQSYTENPLVDLVSAIASELGGNKSKKLKKTLIDISLHLAKIGSRGVIDRDAIRRKRWETFDPWHEASTKVGEFKDALAQAATKSPGPGPGRLIVLIDELDRCRPNYALALIETDRHLFAVDGVVVLLALNREELCHSIRILYGPRFDADRYLRRFTDLPYALSLPATDHLAAFTNELLANLGLDSRLVTMIGGSDVPDYSPLMLQTIAAASRHNLRDLQQALHLTAVSLQSAKIRQGTAGDSWASKQKAAALIVLRTLDMTSYQHLANKGDPFTAVATMNRAITDDPQTLADISTWDKAHEKIEASLLAESLDVLLMSSTSVLEGNSAHSVFERQYASAFAAAFEDTPDATDAAGIRASKILAATDTWLGEQPTSTLRLDELFGIIDLTAH